MNQLSQSSLKRAYCDDDHDDEKDECCSIDPPSSPGALFGGETMVKWSMIRYCSQIKKPKVDFQFMSDVAKTYAEMKSTGMPIILTKLREKYNMVKAACEFYQTEFSNGYNQIIQMSTKTATAIVRLKRKDIDTKIGFLDNCMDDCRHDKRLARRQAQSIYNDNGWRTAREHVNEISVSLHEQ
ncbi:hypothetical protein HDU76_004973 [Blyttiomyces sp. JEL0837]|nr:hypothetical protein HDU76_004973 [Blyttiomyces sp. JEL0837]